MFNFPKEIIIVLVIVLIIFGPSQLPKLGKMFGKTMKGLRDGMENPDADEAEAEPVPEAKPKEVKAASDSDDVAAELERLKAENAKLAAEAAKKADAKTVADDAE
jgi:sec-independent protein translocase protein TatA